ncbi:hypothetical protein C0995_010932, partial [Termitomyces sp. Mi166
MDSNPLTLGSDAILALLSQVNATLEAISLAEDRSIVPCTELQKHCDAMDLAAQQQLYSFDISLQTFKIISKCLDRLNKALGSSDVGAQFQELQELQVISEAERDDLDVKFPDPSLTNSGSTQP